MNGLKEKPLGCWACELAEGYKSQHKTRWFWLCDSGIVVEDLNAKQWDIRLLYVPRFHVACGDELASDYKFAEDLLSTIARRYLPDFKIVSYDTKEHSYKVHWHAQANLRRKNDQREQED